jgi:Skp family chaperone for outer membrane proteins
VRSLLVSAVFSVLVFSGRASLAQQASPQGNAPAPGVNAPHFRVAVVDISHVFKNYPWFNAQIEALKKEMETADAALKADRDRLIQLEQQRETFKPGSPDFKKADEDLARLKADFSIKQGTIRRDFLERESKIYFTTYTHVSQAVRYVAQQNNIGMVLRFNHEPIEKIDPSQRDAVMAAIMQPIVFQHNIDITYDVEALMNRGSGNAAASQGSTPTATRPTGGPR